MLRVDLNGKNSWRPYLLGLSSILLVGCANNPSKPALNEIVDRKVDRAALGAEAQPASPLEVNQISPTQTNFEALQISSDVHAEQLTIEQLKAYVDRCAPGRSELALGIDCSELSLRVKKVFHSDDKIQEALITLDRLGRTENDTTGEKELQQNARNLSISAQGIANGLLDPSLPELPEEATTIDLDSILDEIESQRNTGAIINSSG